MKCHLHIQLLFVKPLLNPILATLNSKLFQISTKLLKMKHLKSISFILVLAVVRMNADEGAARLLLSKQVKNLESLNNPIT